VPANLTRTWHHPPMAQSTQYPSSGSSRWLSGDPNIETSCSLIHYPNFGTVPCHNGVSYSTRQQPNQSPEPDLKKDSHEIGNHLCLRLQFCREAVYVTGKGWLSSLPNTMSTIICQRAFLFRPLDPVRCFQEPPALSQIYFAQRTCRGRDISRDPEPVPIAFHQ
jgi:hypothetical protein